jgi:hypothetical protein
VPAHILPEVVAITGFAMAFKLNVPTFVHVPFAPITDPEIIALPFEVPIICEPFNVFVLIPTMLVQVKLAALLAVKVTVFGEPLKLFIQIVGLLATILTVGSGNTLTVILAMFVQVACDPRTLYVVVTLGFAEVFGVLVDVNARLGLQVYVVAPLAVKLIEFPIQITAGFGLMVTVGLGTTLAVAF